MSIDGEKLKGKATDIFQDFVTDHAQNAFGSLNDAVGLANDFGIIDDTKKNDFISMIKNFFSSILEAVGIDINKVTEVAEASAAPETPAAPAANPAAAHAAAAAVPAAGAGQGTPVAAAPTTPPRVPAAAKPPVRTVPRVS